MADLVAGAVLGAAFAEANLVVRQQIKATRKFSPHIKSIESTLSYLGPQIEEMMRINKQLDYDKEVKPLLDMLNEGRDLINKCQKVTTWQLWDKYSYSKKLVDLDNRILWFCQTVLVKTNRFDMAEVTDRIGRVSVLPLEKETSSRGIQFKSCNVPPQGPDDIVVGLDDLFNNIKEALLRYGTEQVVIISGAGGYGKTTLVKKLCHDQQVTGKYKDNIIFIVVSESPDLMAVVQQIINHLGETVPDPKIHTEDDAVQQLQQLLAERGKQDPILLVLDDIWSGSESTILEKFVNKEIPNYKVLVTSRSELPTFGRSYQLKGLEHGDAVKLLRHTATPLVGSYTLPSDEIIEEVAEHCKGSPLALILVGKSLCGKHKSAWKTKLSEWSTGVPLSGTDESKSEILNCLTNSLKDLDRSEELRRVKQFFLDLCSFPEDYMIPVAVLIDMWSELYNVDGNGVDSVAAIKELSARSLADLIVRREDEDGDLSYDDMYVRLHPLLRDLAIYQNSKGQSEERERLNLNIQNNELPNWCKEQKQPLRARLLSICTDETFSSSSWPDLELPEVEVVILNLRTVKDCCTLPNFIGTMVNLRSLIVINKNGSLPVELSNLDVLGFLPKLKKIRLVHIKTPPFHSMSAACLNNLRKVLLFQGTSPEGSVIVRFCQINLSNITANGTLKEANMPVKFESDEFLVGLDAYFEKMKKKVLHGAENVLIVSAPGGYGKTTLVKKLCRDEEVKVKYKENILFIALSQSPNLIAIIQQMLHWKGKTVRVVHNEGDAIHHFHQLVAELGEVNPVLLVLDDMWPGSESILKKFILERISNYKILVTSRDEVPNFGPSYPLDRLDSRDAKKLLCHVATQAGSSTLPNEGIIDKVVQHCGGSPLALTLVGKSLCGRGPAIWEKRLIEWSDVIQLTDTDKSIRPTLRCILNSLKCLDGLSGLASIKQFFLDLSSFPANHNIPLAALIDMWSELHDIDANGVDAVADVKELDARRLASFIVTRKYSSEGDGYYNEMYVMQHHLLREVALLQNSLGPVQQRTRLNLDICRNKFPDWFQKQKKPFEARLLSISTDETFSRPWPDVEMPEVEALVLNFWATRKYTLPNFIKKMNKMKTLTVINNGFFPVEVVNFHLLANLPNLKRVRLERIKIPFLSSMPESARFERLEKVTISNCSISEQIISSDARICEASPNLEEIDISECSDLQSLPAGICDIASLTKISITHCENLSQLPERIGNLSKLQVLRVSCCKEFSMLPDTIVELKNLSFLDISNCSRIHSLPYEFGQLCNLKELHINGCLSLSGLPQSVSGLNKLKHLYCDTQNAEFKTDFPEPYPELVVVEEDRQ